MTSSTQPELPFLLRHDSIESWLAALPAKNARDCCRILYAALQAMNGTDLDPQVSFHVLERFRPLILLNSRELCPFFLGKPFPLDTRVRKIAKLSAQFHAELAKGYQAIARQKFFAEVFGFEARARIFHRALQSYDLFLLRLALMYEAPSSSVWEQINELFRLAEQADALHWAEPDTESGQASAASVVDLFKRIFAWRLAVPNRLSQEDIQRFHDLLNQYGMLIELGPNPGEHGARVGFSIDLDSAQAPRFREQAAADHGSLRYLSLGPFVAKLAALSQPTVPVPSRLKASLSVYLQVRLNVTPPFLPEQKSRDALLVLGLDSLVSALAAFNLKAQRQEVSWTGINNLELVPLSDHVGLHPRAESSKSAGTFAAAAAMNRVFKPRGEAVIWGDREGQFPCQVYRTEAPGYYLLEHAGAALRAGTLVGLNTDNKLIQVGLISGGNHENKPSLYGFELLASDVGLARIYNNAAPSNGHMGLFFKAPCARKGCFELIVPPLKLRGGELLTVEWEGRRETYRIAKLLEATAEFGHFEIGREEGQAAG